MKVPDLLVLLGLINVFSLILITGSYFQNYAIFFENNYHILLEIPLIYAQDNDGSFDDDYLFPPFEESGSFDDDYIFPPFEDRDIIEDRDRENDDDS